VSLHRRRVRLSDRTRSESAGPLARYPRLLMHDTAGWTIASVAGRSQRSMRCHASVAADDRFAQPDVAKLTIALATLQSPGPRA
jgi:hypothetical protein